MNAKRKSKQKSSPKPVAKKKTLRNTGKTTEEITGMLSEDFFGRVAQSIGYEAYEQMCLNIALETEDTVRGWEADPEHPEDALLQFLDEYRLTHPEFTK
jgi:hypothetical protein